MNGVTEAFESLMSNIYKNINGASIKIDKKHVEREQIFNEQDMIRLFMARAEDIKNGRTPTLGKKHP